MTSGHFTHRLCILFFFLTTCLLQPKRLQKENYLRLDDVMSETKYNWLFLHQTEAGLLGLEAEVWTAHEDQFCIFVDALKGCRSLTDEW